MVPQGKVTTCLDILLHFDASALNLFQVCPTYLALVQLLLISMLLQYYPHRQPHRQSIEIVKRDWDSPLRFLLQASKTPGSVLDPMGYSDYGPIATMNDTTLLRKHRL